MVSPFRNRIATIAVPKKNVVNLIRNTVKRTYRYGTVQYGAVRYGTVRYGTVRYGVTLSWILQEKRPDWSERVENNENTSRPMPAKLHCDTTLRGPQAQVLKFFKL
jgi:hypothetical protein